MTWMSPRRARPARADRTDRADRADGADGRARARAAGYGLVTTVSCAAAVLLALPAPAAPARAPAGPAVAAPATTGAGNGVERQSARQIAARTSRALQGATSLHTHLVDRTARLNKHRPMTTDLRLDRRGNCQARLTYANGGNVALVKRGTHVWLRPNDTFWKTQVPGKAGRTAASFLHGRFVQGTTSSAFLQEAARLCDLRGFRKEIDTAATGASTLHKGRTTTVAGTRSVPISGRRNGRNTTVFVSAVGTAFPLRATVRGRTANVMVNLSDFNKPVPSKTPAPSDSVSVSELEARLSGGG